MSVMCKIAGSSSISAHISYVISTTTKRTWVQMKTDYWQNEITKLSQQQPPSITSIVLQERKKIATSKSSLHFLKQIINREEQMQITDQLVNTMFSLQILEYKTPKQKLKLHDTYMCVCFFFRFYFFWCAFLFLYAFCSPRLTNSMVC